MPKVGLARTLAIAHRARRGADGRRTVSSLLRTTPVQAPTLRFRFFAKCAFATKKRSTNAPFWCRRWDVYLLPGRQTLRSLAFGADLRGCHVFSVGAPHPFKSHIDTKKHSLSRVLLVPKVGLEPTRCRQQWILSPSRLPFHHFGLLTYYIIITRRFASIFHIQFACGQNSFRARRTTARFRNENAPFPSARHSMHCTKDKFVRLPTTSAAATKKIPLENRRRRRGIASSPRESRCFYKKNARQPPVPPCA